MAGADLRLGDIRFGVQANLTADAAAWLDLAAKVEDLGFDALYVADHLGVTASPFTALAAAAADAATLDYLSTGRVILGLGAGHTSSEWTMTGLAYPSAADRVARLAEMVDVVTALLAGEVVTHHGRFLDLDAAELAAPRPVQSKVPLLLGGNGRTLLALAGHRADIVDLLAPVLERLRS